MSDFQDALGELVELETPDSVTPFSVLQQRRARRARRRAVVVSCAAVAALAFGAAAVAGVVDRNDVGPATDGKYFADGPAPERITVDGIELKLEGVTRFDNARLSPGSQTEIVVEAGANPPQTPHPCRVWTTVRILKQDDRSVRLGAFEYRYADPPMTEICTLEGYLPSVFELDLGGPLGDRELIDDVTGDPVALADPGDTLSARYLPVGYSTPGTFRLDPPTTTDNGVSLWTHQGPARATLEIHQGPPDAAGSLVTGDDVAGETVLARPTVRGRPGKVFRSGSFTERLCLKWPESAGLIVNVCSLGDPAPLDAGELVRVAESLSRSKDRGTPQPTVTARVEPTATPSSAPVGGGPVVPAPTREPQGQYGGATYDHLEVVVTGAYKNTENTVLDIFVEVLEQGSRVLSYDVDFGDGTTASGRPSTSCPKPLERYTERYTFRHAYPDGFRSTFTVRIRTGDCETEGEMAVRTSEVRGGVRQGSAT